MRMGAFWPIRSPIGEVVKVGFGSNWVVGLARRIIVGGWIIVGGLFFRYLKRGFADVL